MERLSRIKRLTNTPENMVTNNYNKRVYITLKLRISQIICFFECATSLEIHFVYFCTVFQCVSIVEASNWQGFPFQMRQDVNGLLHMKTILACSTI